MFEAADAVSPASSFGGVASSTIVAASFSAFVVSCSGGAAAFSMSVVVASSGAGVGASVFAAAGRFRIVGALDVLVRLFLRGLRLVAVGGAASVAAVALITSLSILVARK